MTPSSRTTAILGFGRFGRALSELLLDAGYPVRALDPVSKIPVSLRADSLEELVRDAEAVVLALPVERIAEATSALRPHLREHHLILDVASVKRGPVSDLRSILGSNFAWVATHPLFGPTSIALGERPLVTVVCPNPLRPEAAPRASSFFRSLGCEVIEEDAEEHDRTMALTHALAFFVAKGLMDIRAGEGAAFVPPSFRAMARTIAAVRSDASHLFATIQKGNPFAAEARRRLLSALTDIDRDLVAPSEAARPPAPTLAIAPLDEDAEDLRDARDLIDDIDRDLVQLLGRRVQLLRRAGRAEGRPQGPLGENPGPAERGSWARRLWSEREGLEPGEVERIFEGILLLSQGRKG